MAKIYNLIEPISILLGKIYIDSLFELISLLILYLFFRLILNCDIENIDVRTIDPFNASILSDYKVKNVIKILDENIFRNINKLME